MFPTSHQVSHLVPSDAPSTPSFWEILGIVLALALGWHFLELRICGGGLPTGDEGSWISVASEIAHGHGFTTRWLEAHFLLPYTLPRPDDFRYPVLTSLIAITFKVWGNSVETARWTVAGIFLVFSLATWSVTRYAFGRWPAMAVLWLTVSSLLQLEWNAAVYTEGMFGLVVTAIVAWCIFGDRSTGKVNAFGLESLYWWTILGIGIGCLYLVRVNGILFLPGVFWLYWMRRNTPLTWMHPAITMLAFCVIVAPWLIRTHINFGSPFHFAGSGGLLREPGQSHTMTLFQYFSGHNLIFPFERIGVGIFRFSKTLHFYEHGLEIIPLLLVLVAVASRRMFYNPLITLGFLLTFLASAYSAYNSWAGVRYMTGLMPLIYAYGFSAIPASWSSKRIPFVLGIILLWLPVFYPHRFYERKFSSRIAAQGTYPYRTDLSDHLNLLATRLPAGGHYYAASLCNVNFLVADRYCVGLQELYDPTWFSRSRDAFHPSLIVLTHSETQDSVMLAAFSKMRSEGYFPDTVENGKLAIYFSLHSNSLETKNVP